MLLQRLDIQASSFDGRRIPIRSLDSILETRGLTPIVPESFLDLIHAENVLTKLQNWTLHHMVMYLAYKGRPAEEFPKDLLWERFVLGGPFERYAVALWRLGSSEKLQSDVSHETVLEEARLHQIQQFLLLRTHLHTFHYLVKENIPIPAGATMTAAAARDGTIPLSEQFPSSSQAFAHSMAPSPNNNTIGGDDDLHVALSGIETLLSLSNSSPQAPSLTSPLASPSQRTYSLSTHLVAGLYFLCLKTTSVPTLTKAFSLFSHPLVRNSRDGLWDARTPALVVENLARLKDSKMQRLSKGEHPCWGVEREPTPAPISCGEHWKSGRSRVKVGKRLPMMQSKPYRTIKACVRPDCGQETHSNTTNLSTANDDANIDSSLLLLPPYLPNISHSSSPSG